MRFKLGHFFVLKNGIYMFQSLTGAIQTGYIVVIVCNEQKVSIPHRCDSNQRCCWDERKHLACFNPSQVRFKQL
ncbi:MAG: hypothetical protein NZ923_10840 [Candidatus Kryptonium sp.]|nr:hypothetical protein [Candidatus Kryptonium sp.]